jgi:zinc/manganese transport system substrate-binding protein
MVLVSAPTARARSPRGRRRRRRGALAGLTATTLALATLGCAAPAPASQHVIHAVGAENQYADVISQIGGRYVEVSAIMSNPSTDPHTFEASTGVAQEIAAAQLVVQNGVGYDTFMDQLESASPSRGRQVINVQHLLGLPLDTANPHLWYKPTTMAAVATRVEKDLVALDPSHRGYFTQRLAAFQASLAGLTSAIDAFRARFAGDTVATTEPVADYLLSALGLKDLTPFRFQADIMNGVDPSPEDIVFQQNLFVHHRVKMLCYNAQVSSSVTAALRTLAQRSKVPVVAVYETMPTPGYDYQSWMLAEITAMTKALALGRSTKTLL